MLTHSLTNEAFAALGGPALVYVREIRAQEILGQASAEQIETFHLEPDQTLYFVLRGKLEVIVRSNDGMSMGRVALVGAGSVLGELAFFDGGPRSAGAWAVDACEVAAMSPEQYAAFEEANPVLAHELLFALGRLLAIRLRKTNARIGG